MTQQEQAKKITLSYLLITFAIMGLTWGGICIAQQYGYLKNNSTMFYPLYILGGASTMYTNPNYRRKGIAYHMLELLIEEAKNKGVKHISLEATDMGKFLLNAMVL